MTFTISRDANGNKVCKVRPNRGRGFSIQTNGNLPITDRNGVCHATSEEVAYYVEAYGTSRQQRAIAATPSAVRL